MSCKEVRTFWLDMGAPISLLSRDSHAVASPDCRTPRQARTPIHVAGCRAYPLRPAQSSTRMAMSVIQRLGWFAPSSISKCEAPSWTRCRSHLPSGWRARSTASSASATRSSARHARVAQVVEAAQHVVVVPGRERELEPGRDRSPRRSTSGGTCGAPACSPRRAGAPRRHAPSRRRHARARAALPGR